MSQKVPQFFFKSQKKNLKKKNRLTVFHNAFCTTFKKKLKKKKILCPCTTF